MAFDTMRLVPRPRGQAEVDLFAQDAEVMH